jgi:N-acylneuraminate cytidylyltransferase
MKSLVFIFARKGSKRIKNKNMKILNGKPLIEHTIDFIKKLKLIKSTVVSTDDEKIIKYCKKNDIKNIIVRPKSLTGDNSNEFLSWKHAIKKIQNNRKKFETFICLPLTSPLRLKKEFILAYKTFKKKKPDMIISICKTNHYPGFNIVKRKYKNKIKLIGNNNISNNYRKNIFNLTTSFYIANKNFILRNKKIDFKKHNIIGHEVSRKSGLDIDDKYDFEIAKLFLSKI